MAGLKPFVKQEDDVGKLVTGLMSQKNPLMKQANTAGLKTANRRGLLNSSMAAQAAQAEGYKVALPIASQTAGQNAAANLSDQNFGQSRTLQTDAIKSTEKMQGLEIGSRERMQMADNAAAKERLGMQLTTAEREALRDRQQQTSMQQRDLTNQQKMQANDYNFRASEGALDRNQQIRLAAMNLSAQEQQTVIGSLTSIQALHQNTIANINNNKSLKKKDRRAMIQKAEATQKKQIAALEKLYSVKIPW